MDWLSRLLEQVEALRDQRGVVPVEPLLSAREAAVSQGNPEAVGKFLDLLSQGAHERSDPALVQWCIARVPDPTSARQRVYWHSIRNVERYLAGDLAGSVLHAEAATRAAREDGDQRLLLRAANRTAILYCMQARWQDAVDLLHPFLTRPGGEPALSAAARHTRAAAHLHLGNPDEAEADIRAGELVAGGRSRRARAFAMERLGAVAWCRGDCAVALVRYQASQHIFDEIGLSKAAATAATNVAMVLCEIGRLEEAREVATAVLPSAELAGHARVILAQVALAEGRPDDASRWLDAPGTVWLASGRVEAAVVRVRAALATGQWDRAAQVLEAESWSYDVRTQAWESVLRAELALQRGEVEPALTLLDGARIDVGGPDLFDRAWQLRLRAAASLGGARLQEEAAGYARATCARRRAVTSGQIELLAVATRYDDLLARARRDRQSLQALDEANARLERLARDRTQAITALAHDLRSPLSVILSSAELLEERLRGQPESQDLEMIVAAATRIEADLRRELQLSADSSTDVSSSEATFDLRDLLEDLVRGLQTVARRKGSRIAMHNAERTVVHADRSAIRDILENLISNAIKFSPPNSTITVRSGWRVEEGGELHARIEVDDEGPGFTEDDRRKLFRRMARLSARPTAGEVTTGLGLFLSAKAAERCGARLELLDRPGPGSTFALTIAVNVT